MFKQIFGSLSTRGVHLTHSPLELTRQTFTLPQNMHIMNGNKQRFH